MSDFEEFVREVHSQIQYKDGYRLLLEKDERAGKFYFQVECDRPDAFTKVMGVGRGGKAYLSTEMTRSTLVRLAFKLFISYEEHECREFFLYNGRRIFGPHVTIDALWEVADRIE